MLYTAVRKPILVPVFDVHVPVGEYKIQGDFQTSSNKTTFGARGCVESFPLPSFRKDDSGIKLELNAGFKFELKIPDFFTE